MPFRWPGYVSRYTRTRQINISARNLNVGMMLRPTWRALSLRSLNEALLYKLVTLNCPALWLFPRPSSFPASSVSLVAVPHRTAPRPARSTWRC